MVVAVNEAFAALIKCKPVGGWRQIEVVVLEGAPEALDEDVVDRTPFTVHADLDAFGHATLAEQGGVEVVYPIRTGLDQM